MRIHLALAAAAVLTAGTAAADLEVTHAFASSAPRHGISRVIVDIPAGEVRIRNGAADRISVNGEVHRSYNGHRRRDREQRIADDASVEIYVNGDEAVVRRRFGPNAESWSGRSFHTGFDVRLEVPAGVDIIVETRFGEIDAEGTFGNLECDLRAGEIHIRTPRANVRDLSASVRIGEVHTNLGDEILEREGLFPGRTHFVNANGRADVHVHTTFGEVHVTLTR
jgi:hypothetical protein